MNERDPHPPGDEESVRPSHQRQAREDMARAERWLRTDPRDRRWIMRGIVAALVLHAAVLFARIPGWGEPRRVEMPLEEAMQVEFLKPPPPPPPPAKEKPKPKPKAKPIPRPDPTPDEVEPIPEPEPPLPEVQTPEPPPVAAPPAPPQLTGPIRVSPGQGPGLIKRVEPEYPRVLQSARVQGSVVLDAIVRTDGSVADVKVLEATHPMFAQAAVEAIKQWRYSPPPNDVILTVKVNFTLK